MNVEPILIEVGEKDFAERVVGAKGVVVVEFWAPWCGPCLEMAPLTEALSKTYAGRAIVARVNADENGKLAKRLQVRNIPAILFYQDGKLVDRLDGAVMMESLVQKLESVLFSAEPEDEQRGLEEARQMLAQGLITPEEFEETKRQILGGSVS